MAMQNHSAGIQGSQGKLTSHSIIHLLPSFLGHFQRNVTTKKLRYLYHPGDSSRGIEATLCGLERDQDGSIKNAFRDILISEGLCESTCWEDMARRVETDYSSSKKKWDWKDQSDLSSVFISAWVEKFSKVAFETLKDLIEKYPQFSKVDENLQLGLIPGMTLAQFQRMFQHHHGSQYPKEGSLDSFRLDADQLPKEPIVLRVFKKQSRLDLISGDPYRKTTGRMLQGKNMEYFPPSLLEFVWLLMYAHFSEDSFKYIFSLSDSLTTSQANAPNEKGRALARRYLRCVIFTISTSHSSSVKYWQCGYFPKDRSGTSIMANKMSKSTQTLFLMMSAISETCPFFQRIGINPQLPELTLPIHDWAEENDFPEFDESLQDAVLILTFLFCYQVHQHNKYKGVDKTSKKDACSLLDATIRGSTGLSDVTCFGKDNKEKWIGNFTLGGSRTLSMSPDPVKLEALFKKRGHLLEVLGDDR